uniref:Uncharacterized protein n=1 Tax=Sipha flava TaxID=143950 RepID=A0A2S2Q6E3_9HEMI
MFYEKKKKRSSRDIYKITSRRVAPVGGRLIVVLIHSFSPSGRDQRNDSDGTKIQQLNAHRCAKRFVVRQTDRSNENRYKTVRILVYHCDLINRIELSGWGAGGLAQRSVLEAERTARRGSRRLHELDRRHSGRIVRLVRVLLVLGVVVVRQLLLGVLAPRGRRRLYARVDVQHAHLTQEQHLVDQPLGDDHRLSVHLPQLVGRVPAETVVVVGHRRLGRVAAHAAQYLRIVEVARGRLRVPVRGLRRGRGRRRRPGRVQYPPPPLRPNRATRPGAPFVHDHLQTAGCRRLLRFGGTRVLVLGPGSVLVHQYLSLVRLVIFVTIIRITAAQSHPFFALMLVV